jgi:hypothetical protein
LVPLLEAPREGDARRADVDADDAGARPANGIVRSLRGAATRDQDAAVVAIRLTRPKEIRIGAAAAVVPTPPVFLKIVDRRRIGVALVKAAYPAAGQILVCEPDALAAVGDGDLRENVVQVE